MPRHRRPPREVEIVMNREVWLRDKGVCQSPLAPPACEGKPFIDFDHCQIDHIIPVTSGGSHRSENKRVLCAVCHALRADHSHAGLFARMLRKGRLPANWRDLIWEG